MTATNFWSNTTGGFAVFAFELVIDSSLVLFPKQETSRPE